MKGGGGGGGTGGGGGGGGSGSSGGGGGGGHSGGGGSHSEGGGSTGEGGNGDGEGSSGGKSENGGSGSKDNGGLINQNENWKGPSIGSNSFLPRNVLLIFPICIISIVLGFCIYFVCSKCRKSEDDLDSDDDYYHRWLD